MIILIAAAVVAAGQPAPVAGQQAQPAQQEHMQMGQNGQGPKGMDCCKDCCKDMAKEHKGHAEHKGHSGR